MERMGFLLVPKSMEKSLDNFAYWKLLLTALFCFHSDISFSWRGSLMHFFENCLFPRNKKHFKDLRTFLKNIWCKLADLISFGPEHVRFLLWFCLQGSWFLKCAKSCTDRKRLQRVFLLSGLEAPVTWWINVTTVLNLLSSVSWLFIMFLCEKVKFFTQKEKIDLIQEMAKLSL